MGSTPFRCETDQTVTSPVAESASGDETRVSDTQYMMEALHGTSAALATVAIACDRMVDGDPEEAAFWMRVHRAILSSTAEAQLGGQLLH